MGTVPNGFAKNFDVTQGLSLTVEEAPFVERQKFELYPIVTLKQVQGDGGWFKVSVYWLRAMVCQLGGRGKSLKGQSPKNFDVLQGLSPWGLSLTV